MDFPHGDGNGIENRIHICTFPLFKGMSIKIDSDMTAWKNEAIRVEQKCNRRREQNAQMFRNKLIDVESSLQRKRNLTKHGSKDSTSGADFNHNFTSNDDKTTHQRTSLDYQDSDCQIVSDGSILRSCLHLSARHHENDSTDPAAKTINFPTRYDNNEKEESENNRSRGLSKTMDNLSNFFVKEKIGTEGIFDKKQTSRVDDPLAILSNKEGDNVDIRHTTATSTSMEFVPEVQEQLEELHHLQNQQKQLDDWYLNMQNQLELEKVRLVERYDHMRLQNIKEQQKIIENSQEYLKNSNPELCNTINSDIPEISFEKKSINIKEQNEHKSKEVTGAHASPDRISQFSSVQFQNSPKHELELEDMSAGETDVFPSSTSTFPIPTQNSAFSKSVVSSSLTTETTATDPSAIGAAFGLETLSYTDSFIPQRSPVTKTSPEFVTPRTSHLFRHGVSSENNDAANVPRKSTAGDLLSQHYHMVDDKLRRKSRAMKFFNTPVSTEKDNSTQQFTTPEHHHQTSNAPSTEEGFTSTSTPQEAENILQVPYDLSPVFADEIPIFQTLDYSKSKSRSQLHPDKRGQLAIALFKGFMVRRLMKTYKVKEIIKTIKDTNLFLQDVENEKSLTIADRQLRVRLNEELSTKHQKLHDIFFQMSTTEQLRLIAISRKQEEERKIKKVKKMVEGPKTPCVGKQLSTASQKSMERRAQQSKTTQSVKAATPLKNRTRTNKVKKQTNNEVRVLKPIQSNSPTFKRRPMITTPLTARKKTNNSPFKISKTTKNRYSTAQLS